MISKLIIVGWTIFIGYSFLSGMLEVAAGDPTGELLPIALTFSIVVHLGAWSLVALPTMVIRQLFPAQARVRSPRERDCSYSAGDVKKNIFGHIAVAQRLVVL